jgi:hypothetical protein
VALGLKACASGYWSAFVTAAALLTNLIKACSENRLEERLKLLCQPRLLIIDEIGYLPIDRLSANLFFQLVSVIQPPQPLLLERVEVVGGVPHDSRVSPYFWLAQLVPKVTVPPSRE